MNFIPLRPEKVDRKSSLGKGCRPYDPSFQGGWYGGDEHPIRDGCFETVAAMLMFLKSRWVSPIILSPRNFAQMVSDACVDGLNQAPPSN